MPDRPALPAAVLWDLDGTLVDTEPAWIAAEHELVESFGGRWSDELAHQLVGRALLDSADFIRAHSPVDLAPADIVERLLDRVTQSVRRDPPWRPGALGLLAQLASLGVPTALVTMSYAVLARAVVDALPAGLGFDVVVTGDQVENGKPHPEAYLTAVAALGVPASRCVAIEDSPGGMASAVAAGVPTVVVPHVVPVDLLPGSTGLDSLVGLDAHRLVDLRTRAQVSRQP